MTSTGLEMIKTKIGDRIYDVVSDVYDYQTNQDAYLQGYTAIKSSNGEYVLPVVKENETRSPGIYVNGVFSKEFLPKNDRDKEMYSIKNAVNLSDTKNIGELLQKQTAVREIEHEILTDVNNIFTPKINENDSVEIKALKEAVVSKHIDLDKYEPRFNGNYNNDKRLLYKDRISLPMMVRICNALDIKATLTLEDQSPDVPNPIGKVIQVELTNGEEVE